MAMNFWEAQRRARSRTALYVTIFIVLTIVVAFSSEMAMRYLAAESYETDIPYVGLTYIIITFTVAIFQYMMFCTQGGSYVAESVGAWRIDPKTTDPDQRRLLNIVQEISIAAALPMPPVYILKAYQINAFAAGTTHENAAITITTGSYNMLNRDELQGVIAHEFGHIYNADMKINMRIAAMVMGFFFVLYIALRIMQFASLTDRDRDRNREGQRGANPILLAALILMAAGALTWVGGSILKCAISREREYLADACAVQFTRNPEGIANALRKIEKETRDDMPKEGMAFSHMYLDIHMGVNSLFATHPPIVKRRSAIEGREYMPEEWIKALDEKRTPT